MTMHERMHRRKPDSPFNRENILKKREQRRALVIEYLDHVDRANAVGMCAKTLAERTGLVAQSVMMTLFSLMKEGVAIKKTDEHGTPAYFLAPKKAAAIASSDSGAAAIALYRAEKARRDAKLRQVLADAQRELERFDRNVEDAVGANRRRGGQRGGEASRQRAAARRLQANA